MNLIDVPVNLFNPLVCVGVTLKKRVLFKLAIVLIFTIQFRLLLFAEKSHSPYYKEYSLFV